VPADAERDGRVDAARIQPLDGAPDGGWARGRHADVSRVGLALGAHRRHRRQVAGNAGTPDARERHAVILAAGREIVEPIRYRTCSTAG
jgi:hypothetical protein